MTTDSKQALRASGAATLLGAACWTALLVLALGALGWAAAGAGAAGAAVFGGVVVLALFAWGGFVVDLVATVLPRATVLASLVTYAAQITTTLVVLAWVDRRALFLEHREWLAAGVVTGVLAWVVAQIVLTVRRRIPVYDLPPDRLGAVER